MTAWTDGSSPWRTTEECARYLRFITIETGALQRKACLEFLRKQKVDDKPLREWKRGRVVLFLRDQVEQVMTASERRTA